MLEREPRVGYAAALEPTLAWLHVEGIASTSRERAGALSRRFRIVRRPVASEDATIEEVE